MYTKIVRPRTNGPTKTQNHRLRFCGPRRRSPSVRARGEWVTAPWLLGDALEFALHHGDDGLQLRGRVGAVLDDAVERVGVGGAGRRRPQQRRLRLAVLLADRDGVLGRARLQVLGLGRHAVARRDVEAVALGEVELVVGALD